MALINSEGYLEIAVVGGDAAGRHGLRPGHKLKIRKC
ncbi:MAG: SAM hydroxide adenosyltransferase [Pyrobaculum sp.]